MALCPQFPPPSPATQFKALRKLPPLKFPLTDITNFTVAQATLELTNLAPIAARDESPQSQREIPGDAPARRGRGKNRRGRQRGVRPREVGVSISGGKLLRSPIPLAVSSPRSSFHPAFDFRGSRRKSAPAFPILSIASSYRSSPNTTNGHPRTPRRRFPAVTPETPRYGNKQTSPHGKFLFPPSPPSPTPTTRRPSRPSKPSSDSPSGPPSPSLPICFPIPPTSTPLSPRPSPHFNHGNQFSLLPSMNLGSGIVQGQMPKKRSKRDLAEVQWLITMHKSLAWRTTHEHSNAEKKKMCGHCTGAKEDPSRGAMGFAHGGLRIAFERPACTCASGSEPRAGNRCAPLHWTESLDRELVKRLWVKLIAKGCRTIPVGISNPPQVSTPLPTVEHSQCRIPFPSERPEQPLAPAIQFSSTSRPVSDPQLGSRIPLRQRVFAIRSSDKTRLHPSLPNLHVSSPNPSPTPTISMPPSPFLAVDPPYPDCQMPRVSARISRGTLSAAQLTALAILRHEDARSKPMRRGRPPGIMQKGSSLRHEVRAEHAN